MKKLSNAEAEVLIKKRAAVRKTFAIFAGKHLRWSLFLIKLQATWNPSSDNSIRNGFFADSNPERSTQEFKIKRIPSNPRIPNNDLRLKQDLTLSRIMSQKGRIHFKNLTTNAAKAIHYYHYYYHSTNE